MEFNGTFIWNELMSSDVESSKAFYAEVAGWTYTEMNGPDEGTYVLATAPGQSRPIAGMMQWPADQPGANDWMPYLGVTNITDSIEKVVAAGGTVLRPIYEIPGTGHIAIVSDATGTVLGMLQPAPMG